MKKLLCILLAVAMLMVFAVPAMAEGEPSPVEMDIAISSVEVDEIGGYQEPHWNEEGQREGSWTLYDLSIAEIDVTIAGTSYENVSLRELADTVTERYYPEYVASNGLANLINAQIELEQTYENQLQVGNTYECTIVIYFNNTETIVNLAEIPVELTLCETKVQAVTIEPFSYYLANPSDKNMAITTAWKDGSSQIGSPYGMTLERVDSLPTTVGTHTVTYTLGTLFEIPVEVTVLAVPTSGQCGDNMAWVFDETTGTLTISGTGDMYTIAENTDDFWDEKYGFVPAWWYLDVKHIIVEEGVQTLSNFAFFHNYITPESIQLPTTLKKLPDLGFLVSTSITSLTIPEGITSITGWPFGSPGNSFMSLTDLYLPSTLTEIDYLTLFVSGLDNRHATQTLKAIHFAGTEEEWKAITRVDSECIKELFGEDYAGFYENWCVPAKEMVEKLVVFEPKEEVKEEITVEDGTANVPDSSVEITDGEDVVIDVTNTEENVSSVVIGSETVDKIADAEVPVEIKLSDATVSFDKTAIGSIGEQAGETAVTIVAKEVEDTALTTEQKAALEEKEVCAILNLEAYAGETKITEFGGGKVTISVPFELPEGKTGTDYYVAHVADDGTITAMPTTYADGALTFETTHFSNYVVLEDVTVAPPAGNTPGTGDNYQTGDNSPLFLLAVLMLASAAGLTFCVTKRRTF